MTRTKTMFPHFLQNKIGGGTVVSISVGGVGEANACGEIVVTLGSSGASVFEKIVVHRMYGAADLLKSEMRRAVQTRKFTT